MRRSGSKSTSPASGWLSPDHSGQRKFKNFMRRWSTGRTSSATETSESPVGSSNSLIRENERPEGEKTAPRKLSDVREPPTDPNQLLIASSPAPRTSTEQLSVELVEPPKYEPLSSSPSGNHDVKNGAKGGHDQAQVHSTLWSKAVERLNLADRSQLKVPTSSVDSPDELLNETLKAREACIERQLNFRWCGETVKLRDITEKILVWVRKFKEIGDVVVQVDPMHASLPWAALRLLMQCGLADHENMGGILIGIERATNIIGRCAAYERLYLYPSPKTQSALVLELHLVNLYTALLRFLVWGKNYFSKSAAIRITTAVFQDDLPRMLDEIEELEKIVLKRVDVVEAERRRQDFIDLSEKVDSLRLESYSGPNRLRSLLQDFTQPIARVDERLAAMEQNIQDNERTAILSWLSNIEYEKHFYKARAGRVKGTCTWLTDHEKFRNWRASSSSSILWLRGDPGTGKSKLTATVTEACLTHRDETCSQEAVAYFFCDRNEHDRTADHEKIFLTLLKQLSYIGTHGQLQPLVVEEYEERKGTGFASKHPEFDACVELVIALAEIYPQTTIIIDALDEVDPDVRYDVIRALQKIVGECSGLVKLFISSRNEEDLLVYFADTVNHYLSPGDNAEDIELFVNAEVDSYFASRRIRWKVDEEQKREIKSALSGAANGMFLWVDYQLKALSKLSHPDEVGEALKKLPKGLKETYDRIYDAIAQEEGIGQRIALAALTIVAGADIPLQAEEMVGAVYWSPGVEKEFDIDTILGKCHGLVVLDPSEVVRFNHLSCLEYLEKHQNFSLGKAKADLLSSCIRIMMQTNQATEAEHPKLVKILNYATEQWMKLAQAVINQATLIGDLDMKGLHDLIRPFIGEHLTPSDYLRAAAERHDLLHHGYSNREYQRIQHRSPISNQPKPDPLLVAAKLGLIQIFKESSSYDPNFSNMRGESLLMIASAEGHDPIVRKLLDDGADPNLVLTLRGPSTALMESIRANNLEIATLLLERGADVNDLNPVRYAANEGHLEMTKLLIAHGAEANNFTGGTFGSCLQGAAYRGQMHVMTYLLDSGVCDVNGPACGTYGSALQVACVHCGSSGVLRARDRPTDIIKFLIDRGADVNFVGGYHGSALQAACADSLSSDNVEVVTYLLQCGADPNLPGGYLGSPLNAAVYCDDADVVRLLLEAGADPNSPANRRALYNAVTIRKYDIVEHLVESGADCNTPAGRLGCPLHAAAANADERMIRTLMSGNTNVNALDPICRTPLSVVGICRPLMAAEIKACRILLLQHGAVELSVLKKSSLFPSPDSQLEHLRRNVPFLVHEIVDGTARDASNLFTLDILGRCLLLCGDEVNARIVFLILAKEDTTTTIHPKRFDEYKLMCCTNCKTTNPEDPAPLRHRWICKTCARTSLCVRCFESSKIENSLQVKICTDSAHEFFEIADEGLERTDRKDNKEVQLPAGVGSTDVWLRNLEASYDSVSENFL